MTGDEAAPFELAPHQSGGAVPAAAAPAAPPLVARLLGARVGEEAEAAWSAFVAEYTRLLLHVARSPGNERDDTMDAYAYILDRLRRDDLRALRAYTCTAGSRFTTWLVVVTRRICVDFRRQRYGRPRGTEASSGHDADRIARWRLASYGVASPELLALVDEHEVGAEERLHARQLHAALQRAVLELTTEEQLLLRLRFDDGRPVPEIARLMRAPTPFHIYRRLRAICATLRRALARDGFEEGAP